LVANRKKGIGPGANKMISRSLLGSLMFCIALSLSGCASNRETADYRDDQERICHVHHVEMPTKVLQIGYGLPPKPPETYFDRRTARFPNSHATINGGCVLRDTRYAMMRSCPMCEKAEAEFLAKGSWPSSALLDGK
jgi:hypothetical protein